MFKKCLVWSYVRYFYQVVIKELYLQSSQPRSVSWPEPGLCLQDYRGCDRCGAGLGKSYPPSSECKLIPQQQQQQQWPPQQWSSHWQQQLVSPMRPSFPPAQPLSPATCKLYPTELATNLREVFQLLKVPTLAFSHYLLRHYTKQEFQHGK